MPIVELHVLQGYSAAEKVRLSRALSDAVRVVVPANPDAITVLLHEMPSEHYMRGGVTRTGAPALPDAEKVVRAFLRAMQERDLEGAGEYLAADFMMCFPGASPMHHLEDLIDWAASRYRYVRKAYDGFDTAISGGATIVYCRGTLAGEWPDGTPFDGIRFIDRFELEGGLITRQDVWNDIAEERAKHD